MIRASLTHDPCLNHLLREHPLVELGAGREAHLIFQDSRPRRVHQGLTSCFAGLVELLDNNPLVCASAFSVPSPAATLALIALGPVSAARLPVDEIVLQLSAPLEAHDVEWHLEQAGVSQPVTLALDDLDLGSVVALNAFVPIETLDDSTMLDELYAEAYGRSFYVREAPAGDWRVELAANTPYAFYDLRLTLDEPNSLLTVRVMADLKGKLGACQLVHAMNVMAGFEESLGIPDSLGSY